MTQKEIWRILFESLLHIDITRVSYFNKQLEKSSVPPLTFTKCLLAELKIINEYVESSSFKACEIDNKTGEKKYIKNIILLSKVTEGKMMGQIDCNNINEIAKPLLEFAEIILNNDTQNSKQSKKLKKTSYEWQGNRDEELPELYKLMTKEYELIASETTYEQFKAVFTGQPIKSINKIKKTKKFTNVLLTYFVNKLFYNSNPNDYLSIAESCFDGAKNLSQAQTNYTNNQNRLPMHHTLIDNLLKSLQNPL